MSVRRTVVLAVLALAATFLTSAPSQATAPPPPPLGACYSYAYAGWAAETNSSPRVSCSSAHTAKTIGRGYFLAGTTLDTVHSAANELAIGKKCYPALRSAVGTGWAKYEMTAFQLSIFRPTDAQWAAGARWYRCDVVLPGYNRLFALPNANPLVGTAALTTRTRVCYTSGGYLVSCKETHLYKVTGAFAVASTTYPSEAGWRGAAERRCPAIVTTRYYAFNHAGRSEFAVGDKVVTCFNRSTT